jgi:hypothetical protein
LKAIARRLARLEDQFHQELPPLPPINNGHPWTIGDILVARRDQIRRLEAAQQK